LWGKNLGFSHYSAGISADRVQELDTTVEEAVAYNVIFLMLYLDYGYWYEGRE
jgi:hypothetical protein